MQLGEYYTDMIRISLMDSIVIGAAAGLLVATYFGTKIRRERGSTFSDSSYGIAGIILGTLFGYLCMIAVGYFVALSGSPFHGFSGVDLIEWNNSTSIAFTQYQLHAIGFAMLGSWFGIGWGYSIRTEDASLIGNVFASLGLIGLLGGFMLAIMPSFLLSSPNTLTLLNALVGLCYAIALLFNEQRINSLQQPDDSKIEEMIE
jgi:hypothetical protein